MKRVQRTEGFTLVEIALVLVIVSLLLGAGLTGFRSIMDSNRYAETNKALSYTKQALLSYVTLNNFLPCPDVNGDGREDRDTSTSPYTCQAVEGTVPYKDIGLSVAQARDAWGNVFVYHVNERVTNATEICDATHSSSFFCDCKPDSVRDTVDACKYGPPAFANDTPPTARASDSKNMVIKDAASGKTIAEQLSVVLLAKNSNAGAKCATLAADEQENCDGDAVFVAHERTDDPFFDDQLMSISGYEIRKPALTHKDSQIEDETSNLQSLFAESLKRGMETVTVSSNIAKQKRDAMIGALAALDQKLAEAETPLLDRQQCATVPAEIADPNDSNVKVVTGDLNDKLKLKDWRGAQVLGHVLQKGEVEAKKRDGDEKALYVQKSMLGKVKLDTPHSNIVIAGLAPGKIDLKGDADSAHQQVRICGNSILPQEHDEHGEHHDGDHENDHGEGHDEEDHNEGHDEGHGHDHPIKDLYVLNELKSDEAATDLLVRDQAALSVKKAEIKKGNGFVYLYADPVGDADYSVLTDKIEMEGPRQTLAVVGPLGGAQQVKDHDKPKWHHWNLCQHAMQQQMQMMQHFMPGGWHWNGHGHGWHKPKNAKVEFKKANQVTLLVLGNCAAELKFDKPVHHGHGWQHWFSQLHMPSPISVVYAHENEGDDDKDHSGKEHGYGPMSWFRWGDDHDQDHGQGHNKPGMPGAALFVLVDQVSTATASRTGYPIGYGGNVYPSCRLNTFDADDLIVVRGSLFADMNTAGGDDVAYVHTIATEAVSMGEGNDTLVTETLDGVRVNMGDGNDYVSAKAVATGSEVDMGAGDDTLEIEGTIADNATLSGGSGDDTLILHAYDAAAYDGLKSRIYGFETVKLSDGTEIKP